LIINCKPFYSPREFSSFVLVGVYIPPQACVADAIQQLADQITDAEKQHPDSFVIIVGDFNSAKLNKELPKYRQHIKIPTRDENTLDHCYTVLKDAYTGAPQGCVLSPLLFSLYTNDCTSKHTSVKLLKFADDTTIIGLIRDGDESAYRQEAPPLPPLIIQNDTVSSVDSFRFLGSSISRDLKWSTHIDCVQKKAQQRLYFLRQLRKLNLSKELLITFYSAIIQSVICTSITVWFGSATKRDRARLQRTIRAAQIIIGADLPFIQDLHRSRFRKRVVKINADPSHPGHKLFNLLPSGRRYKALYAKTSRYKVSFYSQAVTLL
ncbi:hypothetical protein PO909_013579, partial [Leuciscus waleckii]